MARELSNNQQKVLAFLRSRAGDGVPPSIREICAATGIKSTSCVHRKLEELEELGYIDRDAGHSRGLRLRGMQAEAVPIVGRVTAGLPILAVEQVEGYLPFAAAGHGDRTLFALRVVGESMKNAGILDGDLVVAEQTSVAEDRQIVVALIGEEATVKRFFREPHGVRLQPENEAFEPLYPEECEILGRVIACVRRYE